MESRGDDADDALERSRHAEMRARLRRREEREIEREEGVDLKRGGEVNFLIGLYSTYYTKWYLSARRGLVCGNAV